MARGSSGAGASRGGGGSFGSGSRSGGSGFSSRGSSGFGSSGGSLGRGRMPGSFGSSGSGRTGFGGNQGGYRPRGPAYYPAFGYRRPRIYRTGGGFRRAPRGCGCLSALIPLAILIVVFILVIPTVFSGTTKPSQKVTQSTIERERITASVWTLGIYDELGWLKQQQTAKGLKTFWDKTGVVPFIMIVQTGGELYNRYGGDLEIMAQTEYDIRINNENGLLFIIAATDGDYGFDAYMQPGYNALSVMDNEAQNILKSCFLNWWNKDPNTTSESEVFSGAFEDAGKLIMKVKKPAWVIAAVVLGIAVIVIVLFIFWKRKRTLDAQRDERTKEILQMPLESIPPRDDDIANKYL